jgi:hypothetical protein
MLMSSSLSCLFLQTMFDLLSESFYNKSSSSAKKTFIDIIETWRFKAKKQKEEKSWESTKEFLRTNWNFLYSRTWYERKWWEKSHQLITKQFPTTFSRFMVDSRAWDSFVSFQLRLVHTTFINFLSLSVHWSCVQQK